MGLVRKLLLALLLGVSLANTIVIGQEFLRLYPSTDGVRLENGRILGGDFLAFYTGGVLYRTAPEQLYDYVAQREFQKQLPGFQPESDPYYHFAYPPLVAAILSVLAGFSFEDAFYLFSMVSVGLYLVSFFLVCWTVRVTAPQAIVLGVFWLGFPPFWLSTAAGGQVSAVGLATISLLLFALSKHRELFGGIVLSLGSYKPPLFIVLGAWLFLRGSRLMRLGVFCGAAVVLAANALVASPERLFDWLELLSGYSSGAARSDGTISWPAKGAGLHALALYLSHELDVVPLVGLVLFGIAVVLSLLWVAKSEIRVSRVALIGLPLTVLLSIHVLEYDLVLLLPAMSWLLVSFLRYEPVTFGRLVVLVLLVLSPLLLMVMPRLEGDLFALSPLVIPVLLGVGLLLAVEGSGEKRAAN